MNEKKDIGYIIHGISSLTGRPFYLNENGNFFHTDPEKAFVFTYEDAKGIATELDELRYIEPYPDFDSRTAKKLLVERTKMWGDKYGLSSTTEEEENYIEKVRQSRPFWHPINLFSIIPVEVDDENIVKEYTQICYRTFIQSTTESNLRLSL
ncbi:MAG: hypothetical protein GXO64_03555 [Candidatus Micrarchaeota archaeon]|nr:hypothetical protein [Candidatus Micrarchaeota archaeon]